MIFAGVGRPVIKQEQLDGGFVWGSDTRLLVISTDFVDVFFFARYGRGDAGVIYDLQ